MAIRASELARRLGRSKTEVGESLCTAYAYIARIEDQALSAVPLSTIGSNLSDHLLAAWKQVVEDEEWVLRKVGQVTLQQVGLIPDSGGIRVKDAIETFLRYTDKPMIASRDAVLEGLSQACKERRVSIGRGITYRDLQRQWCGETVVLDPNEDGVWILPPCEPRGPATQASAVGVQPLPLQSYLRIRPRLELAAMRLKQPAVSLSLLLRRRNVRLGASRSAVMFR